MTVWIFLLGCPHLTSDAPSDGPKGTYVIVDGAIVVGDHQVSAAITQVSDDEVPDRNALAPSPYRLGLETSQIALAACWADVAGTSDGWTTYSVDFVVFPSGAASVRSVAPLGYGGALPDGKVDPCVSAVIAGTEFPGERGRDVAVHAVVKLASATGP